jgi:hypothetical protein
VYLNPEIPGPYTYSRYGYSLELSHEPYYVGKGRGSRDLDLSCHSASISRVSPSPISHHLHEALSEHDAFAWETIMILVIGRADRGRGPLLNKTNGGEGWSGRKRKKPHNPMAGKKHTEKSKKKNADRHSKNWIVVHPDGHEDVVFNLHRFCIENDLSTGNMSMVARGKAKAHKGFTCRCLDK